jgi:hypothetical protein
MSKAQHGNREAKKPKKVQEKAAPAALVPMVEKHAPPRPKKR